MGIYVLVVLYVATITMRKIVTQPNDASTVRLMQGESGPNVEEKTSERICFMVDYMVNHFCYEIEGKFSRQVK